MTERRLVIAGAGGLGREVAALAAQCATPFKVDGFLDDRIERGSVIGGLPVLGRISDAPLDRAVIVAIGNPRARRTVVRRLREVGVDDFPALVHSRAQIGPRVMIGAGSVVQAGTVLTCDVVLGQFCLLNIGAGVSHDCTLHDFATLAPGVVLPGTTKLETGAELGIGATLKQGLTVGRGAFLAMGAVLTRDLAEGALAMGVPARVTGELEPWEDEK